MAEPLIITHRGDTQNAPENTVAAFESAIAQGADGVELDIHLTADKHKEGRTREVEISNQSV